MTQYLYLAELEAFVPATQSLTTLRYASGQGFVTGPAETPANTYYDARIKQAVNIKRSLFSDGKLSGRSKVGYGDLVLWNPDGALDALIGYGLAGRSVTIRRGTPGAAYPSGFTTLFVGTMEQAEVSGETVIIKLRDKQLDLMRPLQPLKYGGTNDLPDGLDGVAGDLAGKPKPVCLGQVSNAPIPCVNTAKLIYQVADGLVNTVDAVYDSGVPLLAGFPMTSRTNGFGTSTIYGAIYAAGRFLAVGGTGILQTSADGTTWTTPSGSFPITGRCLAYGGGLFVAGGESGGLATSPDGETWTLRTSGFGSDVILGVAYGNGLWVIGGTNGKLATSSDGITWTLQTSGFGTSYIWTVVFGNGRFLIGGDSGKIALSTDGTTWALGASGYPSYGIIRAGVYGGGLFVLGGNSAPVRTSPDGVTWTQPSTAPNNVTALYYGAGVGGTATRYVAGSATGAVTTSPDGGTWTAESSGFGYAGINSLAYGDGRFVAVGQLGTITSSGLGPAYGSLADLVDDTLAPDPGTCRPYYGTAGSFVRLGASPAGQITADLTQGANAAARTAGQLFAALLQRAGKASGDWSASDVTALDAVAAGVCGYWTAEETTFADVLDQVAASAGAWWGCDASGVYRIKQLTAPSGTAAHSITANDLLRPLARVPLTDQSRGLPPWRSIIRYQRNYAVQVGAGAVGSGNNGSSALAAGVGTGGQDLTTNTAVIATGSTTPRTLADRFAEVANAADFAGADWGEKVAAALASLPATGGIVDARALTGSQSLSADLTISDPYVTILFGRMTLSMGTYGITAPAGTHGLSLLGAGPFSSVGGTPGTGLTVLDYRGTGDAIAIGDSSAATMQVAIQDIGILLTGSGVGTAARGISLTRVTKGDIVRPRVAGLTTASTQVLMALDGSGDFTGFVTIYNPWLGSGNVCLHFTGSGSNAGNANQVIGGSISGVSTGTGIKFSAGSAGNIVLGVDIENLGVGVDFADTTNRNLIEARFESNTTDFQFGATAADNVMRVLSTSSTDPVYTDSGSRNSVLWPRFGLVQRSLLSLSNHTDARASVRITAGSTTDQIAELRLADKGDTAKWSVQKDAANDFQIQNVGTSKNRLSCGSADTILRAEGSGAVKVNTDSGTGGLIVYDGASGQLANLGPTLASYATPIATGTTPATDGQLRLPNNAAIKARNAADSADLQLLLLTTGNNLGLGGSGVGAVQLSDGTDGWQLNSKNWEPFNDAAASLGTSSKRATALYLSGDIEEASGGFAHTVDGWYQDNVAAGQTNVELTRAAGRWTAVRAGSVLGVVAHMTEARTAGTLTVTVYKNTGLAGAAGSTIGLTAVIDGTNTSRKATTQAKDTDTFAAGDELYAVVTTDSSWAPTTSDIRVSLLVEC